MLVQRHLRAVALVALMILAPLSGCFGNSGNDGVVDSGDITITPAVLTGGEFQGVTFTANADVSVFVPYLFIDDGTGFVQNSTILQLEEGQSVQLNMLAPPRTTTAVFQIGEYGRDAFLIRNVDEPWHTWYMRDGHANDSSVIVGEDDDGSDKNTHPLLSVDNMSSPAQSCLL